MTISVSVTHLISKTKMSRVSKYRYRRHNRRKNILNHCSFHPQPTIAKMSLTRILSCQLIGLHCCNRQNNGLQKLVISRYTGTCSWFTGMSTISIIGLSIWVAFENSISGWRQAPFGDGLIVKIGTRGSRLIVIVMTACLFCVWIMEVRCWHLRRWPYSRSWQELQSYENISNI